MQWYLVLICEVNLYACAHTATAFVHMSHAHTNGGCKVLPHVFPVAVFAVCELIYLCFFFRRSSSRFISQTHLTKWTRNTIKHNFRNVLETNWRITDNSDWIQLNSNQCSNWIPQRCSFQLSKSDRAISHVLGRKQNMLIKFVWSSTHSMMLGKCVQFPGQTESWNVAFWDSFFIPHRIHTMQFERIFRTEMIK